MANVRTISQEDLDQYPSLKGKKVGDTLTAEEDYRLRERKENKVAKAERPIAEVKVKKLAPFGRFTATKK